MKERHMAGGFQVTFGSTDPISHAEFWAESDGYRQQPPPDFATWEDRARVSGIPGSEWGDTAAIVDPDGAGPRMLFMRAPEPKTAKSRMHLDIDISDHRSSATERRTQVETEVGRLLMLGATKVTSFDESRGV
jgi:hypothetical protein